MIDKLIYRERLNRAPTLDDRRARKGFNGFIGELQKNGWVDEDAVALKNFKIQYEGHAEKGNNYIEWRAILKKNIRTSPISGFNS